MQPLVLIESKYIRYTKHNRDKGSWVCTAHYSLRRTFPTIRKSLAVLAGNWSASSKALMESFDISLFEVGFSKIANTLAEYNVDIHWEEKEREKAEFAWRQWIRLSERQKEEIAHKLLSDIEPELRKSMKETLNPDVLRVVDTVEVTITTNLGEARNYSFDSIEAAIEFLANFDDQEIAHEEHGPSLFQHTSLREQSSSIEDEA